MSSSVAEPSLFSTGSVQVTKTIVRVGTRSYPINGIGSVDIRSPRRAGLIILAFVAGAAALIASSSGDVDSSVPVGLGVACVVLLGIAYVRPYALVLRTASGDQQALQHRNRTFIQSVKGAIEEAVAQRG